MIERKAPTARLFGTLFVLLAACRGGAPEIAPAQVADAGPATDVAALPDSRLAPDSTGASMSLFELYGRAGVVTGSCIEDDGINRHVARLWDPLGPPNVWAQFRRQAQCLAAAGGGCAALRTCLGFELTIGGPPCATACNGSVFTACGNEGGRAYRFTVDCAKVGLTCDPVTWCSDRPGVACVSDGFMPTCTADGRATVCKNQGLAPGGLCADLQLSCANGACRGSGAACHGGSPGAEGQVYLEGLACEGSRLRACVGDREQTFDCAQQGQGQGFSCQQAGNQFFCGLGGECYPSESMFGTVTCEGNTVVFCNAGRLQRIDCTSLGFSGCEWAPNKGHRGCIPPGIPREIP